MDSSKRNALIIVGLVLVALGLRGWNISLQSYSNDEVIELEDARADFRSIVTAADSFPPLYRLMLGRVLRLTNSHLSGRWMSVFLGTLCIPLGFGCGRLVGGERVGLLTALLTALSPIFVYYSQEARPYALYILVGLAMLYAGLAAIQDDSKSNWIAFAASSIIGCYSHYYASLLLVAIFIAWCLDRLTCRQWRRGWTTWLCIGAACLPTLSLLYTDFAFTEAHSAIEVAADIYALGFTYFTFLSGFTVGPSIGALHEALDNPADVVAGFMPAIIVTGLILAVPLAYGAYALRKNPQVLRTLLLAALLPVLAAALLSWILDLNYNVRYVLVSVFPCLLLIANGLAAIRLRALAIVAVTAIICWYGNGILRRHRLPQYHNEDVAAAASWLATEDAETQNVYVISDYMARTLKFYVQNGTEIRRFPARDLVMARIESEQDLQNALKRVVVDNPSGCWFAVTRAYHGDPSRIFRGWLADDEHVQWGASFPGIELFHWSPPVK